MNNVKIEWASARLPAGAEQLNKTWNVRHWSRVWEYAWAVQQGHPMPDDLVLDAAGGDGVLQCLLAERAGIVINADADAGGLERAKDWYAVFPPARKVRRVLTDLINPCLPPGVFDQVYCVSVLEHIPDPQPVVARLYSLVRPGGKLVMTFDVASYARWNHSIDEAKAAAIAGMFGARLPDAPKDTLAARFEEIYPGSLPGDQPHVDLMCLGISASRPA